MPSVLISCQQWEVILPSWHPLPQLADIVLYQMWSSRVWGKHTLRGAKFQTLRIKSYSIHMTGSWILIIVAKGDASILYQLLWLMAIFQQSQEVLLNITIRFWFREWFDLSMKAIIRRQTLMQPLHREGWYSI